MNRPAAPVGVVGRSRAAAPGEILGTFDIVDPSMREVGAGVLFNGRETRTAPLAVGRYFARASLLSGHRISAPFEVPSPAPDHADRVTAVVDDPGPAAPAGDAGRALLTFLHLGDQPAARILAEAMLAGAVPDAGEDVTAGIAIGYYLLRCRDDRLHEWSRTLLAARPGSFDAHLIRALALLRDPDGWMHARGRLLAATRQGLPVFSAGLRLLDDAIRLLLQGTEDPQLEAARIRYVPYLRAVLNRPLTTFADPGPPAPRRHVAHVRRKRYGLGAAARATAGVLGDAALVRELAAAGRLTATTQIPDLERQQQLRNGVYAIVATVIFERQTRGIEMRRAHYGCSRSLPDLRPDCLDEYHDAVEAAVEYTLRRADTPIPDLAAWLVPRLKAVAVDAHRRRRAATGALTRVRLPRWLVEGLGADPWLTRLAEDMLLWVGISATAGEQVWPLGSWSSLKTRVTGRASSSEHGVARDVEHVLGVMRRRRTWFEKYVERPLGHKTPPTSARAGAELTSPLDLAADRSPDEQRLLDLAAAALDAISHRLRRGDEEPKAVVADVLGTVFGAGEPGAEMGLLPGQESAADRAAALAADPATIDRIVTAVLEIIG
jgi:hypothetical protein